MKKLNQHDGNTIIISEKNKPKNKTRLCYAKVAGLSDILSDNSNFIRRNLTQIYVIKFIKTNQMT